MEKISELEITIEEEKNFHNTLNGVIFRYYAEIPGEKVDISRRINEQFSKIMAWCIG